MTVVAKAVWVGLGVVLVAGCGGGSDTTTVKPSPARTTTKAPASPSASPSPGPTAPVAPDGTRYAACADGNCEVAVAGKQRIKVLDGTLVITKFQAGGELGFEVSFPGNGATGTMASTCGATFYFQRAGSGGRVVSCGSNGKREEPAPAPGETALQLVGWSAADAAVLKLVSG